MAAQRSKSTTDSMRNENKTVSSNKRFTVSTSNGSGHQEKSDGLKLKLKLKPNSTSVSQKKSKYKIQNADAPFAETQNSQPSNENCDDRLVRCCCCCPSSMCRSNCTPNDAKIDTSLVREPLNLGKTDVKQILQCVHNGTVEVKDIVLNECNIIYECRVCRNLFRSLANLLSHKRFHCTKHCCEKMILFDSTTFEYNDEAAIETDHQPSQTSNAAIDAKKASPVESKAAFLETCVQKVNCDKKRKRKSEFQFKFVRIPSNNNAVYQKFVSCNESSNEELNITAKDGAIPDSQEVPVNNTSTDCEQLSVQSSSEVNEPFSETHKVKRKRRSHSTAFESSALKPHSLRVSTKSPEIITTKDASCNICNATFTSKKTLRVHLKTIHAFERLIYPCPFCCMTFKQLSNGTRHMSQIHKKNKTQVKSLREVLRARAYPEPNDSTNAASDESDESCSDEDHKSIDPSSL